MSLWESVLLGAIQGLFMFIPVSSSSHLVLVQHWLAAEGSPLPAPDTPEMILFNLVVHLGTMASVVV
ncbi:MAG: undecaprenyl-diphosphate phosphatase, partial [Dietzia sp.]